MRKKYKDFIEKYPNTWIVFLSVAWVAIVSIAWIITYYTLKDDIKNRGTFGDMFGSVNALFSGFALAGIVVSILLQRKELGYQRDELRATRHEFEIQNKTLKNQRFENTFFNLLSLHHQIVDGIDIEYEYVDNKVYIKRYMSTEPSPRDMIKLKGRDVFKYKYEQLYKILKKCKTEEAEQRTYIDQYTLSQTDFGHYFRNLYRIIKFIDKTTFVSYNEIEGYDKNGATEQVKQIHEMANYKMRYEYVAIIRSQISDYELLWLFYNCLSVNGMEKFKPLVERYTFFKNLPKQELHNPKVAEKYSDRVFKKLL